MKIQRTPEKISDKRMLAWGTGLVIGGTIAGIGGYFWARNTRTEDLVLVLVAAGALVLMGLLMFVAVWIVRSMRKKDEERKIKGSYFLYDFKARKQMTVGDLTAENVAEHVAMMAAMHRKGESLFLEDLLGEESDFEEIDKPLICWFMLYYWNRRDEGELWEQMLGWGPSFGETFARYLSADPDDRDAVSLAGQLRAFSVAQPKPDPMDLRTFLMSREGLIEDRMLNYVKTHLAELIWDPYV